MVAVAAEMLRLDGPERVKQAIEGWEKPVGKETSCSSAWDILVTAFANGEAAAFAVSLIGHVSRINTCRCGPRKVTNKA